MSEKETEDIKTCSSNINAFFYFNFLYSSTSEVYLKIYVILSPLHWSLRPWELGSNRHEQHKREKVLVWFVGRCEQTSLNIFSPFKCVSDTFSQAQQQLKFTCPGVLV